MKEKKKEGRGRGEVGAGDLKESSVKPPFLNLVFKSLMDPSVYIPYFHKKFTKVQFPEMR